MSNTKRYTVSVDVSDDALLVIYYEDDQHSATVVARQLDDGTVHYHIDRTAKPGVDLDTDHLDNRVPMQGIAPLLHPTLDHVVELLTTNAATQYSRANPRPDGTCAHCGLDHDAILQAAVGQPSEDDQMRTLRGFVGPSGPPIH